MINYNYKQEIRNSINEKRKFMDVIKIYKS